MSDASTKSIEPAPNHSVAVRRSSRWSRLCLKELRETLRDRRTLITLVLMPLLVYPILSMVFQRTLLSSLSQGKQTVVIGVTSKDAADFLRSRLLVADMYMKRRDGKLTDPSQLLAAGEKTAVVNSDSTPVASDSTPVTSDSTPEANVEDGRNGTANQNELLKLGAPQFAEINVDQIRFVKHEDLVAEVKGERIDLGILMPSESKTRKFELIHRAGSPLSARALEFVEVRVEALNELFLRQRLTKLGASSKLDIESTRNTIQAERRENMLSTIVPMILILMTVTGAVYPAIDLTAGERERGTLEMLMASPVSRLKLLLAKYVAVVAVAFLTALVNLVAMGITLQATGIGRAIYGEAGLGPLRIIQILALLILFAAFFSAVLLALTSFARSFKEAQAYLIPLMLLSLGPGVVSLLPGLELKGILAITPISNMVLLARDLCNDQVDPVASWVAILATGLYTLAAIGVAAKIFGADAVMSGGQSELRSLFVDEETSSHKVSSVSGALLCLAVLFPVYFITSSFMARINVPIAGRLVIAAVATSLLFGVIPGIAAMIQRLSWRHAFGLNPAVMAAFTVAMLLGFTVWPLAHEIVLFTQWLGFSSITAEQFAQAQTLIDQLRTVSPVLVVACMAVAPAVFEEVFFRGYLFEALRRVTNRRTTILASATLFGLFHVVSNGLLSPERFLPSTFMGLILGWLCYQSGSILPGIVLHGCHNGLLMMLGYYKEELAMLGFGMEDRAHMPLGLIGLSLGTLIFGVLFIAWLPRHRTQHASQSL